MVLVDVTVLDLRDYSVKLIDRMCVKGPQEIPERVKALVEASPEHDPAAKYHINVVVLGQVPDADGSPQVWTPGMPVAKELLKRVSGGS